MKKIAMFLAAAAIAVSANAQQKNVLVGNKATDNIYVGVAAGAEALPSKASIYAYDQSFKVFNPNIAVMIGKNFTPVFGLRLEVDARMNAHKHNCEYNNTTFINGMDVNLLSTWNFMNLFGGYKGEPRAFEISGLYGFGWGHMFGCTDRVNALTSKVGVDFAINFGKYKQFQMFLEPALTYAMQTYSAGTTIGTDTPIDIEGTTVKGNIFRYDATRAIFDLRVGFVYKLGCSNGKHNFSYEQLRDQSEIDALNAKINGLRGDLDKANAATAAATAAAAALQKKLTDCENKPAPVVEKRVANLQPSVVFNLNSAVVQKSQMANVEMIAKYMKNNKDAKVKISGYASPEGSKELNQKLSEKRANAVKDVLVKKYKISADRLETEGLGATDKLFDQVEFNRVALFNDTTK